MAADAANDAPTAPAAPKLDLETTHYDALIVGTGLTESILAASLATAGKTVLHIDSNTWYGSQWASLSLRELIQWTQRSFDAMASRGIHAAMYAPQLSFPAFELDNQEAHEHGWAEPPTEIPAALASLDRHYALSLCPTLLPAAGATIDVLIKSSVASYCTFRMLEHTFMYEADEARGSGALKRVPSSKEDIFKDRSISLPDKRRLMKVLTSVASSDPESEAQPIQSGKPFIDYLKSDQGLSSSLSSALAYGVALSGSSKESTSEAVSKMQTRLRSMGKYGQGAYLIGQYGGAGELAQGYCRCSAVKGSTYILGQEIRGIERLAPSTEQEESPQRWKVDIAGTDVTTDWLILDGESSHLAPRDEQDPRYDSGMAWALGQIVLNRPLHLPRPSPEASEDGEKPLPPETALVIFPPEEDDEEGKDTSTFVLMNGEGTFSTPKGQYVYHLLTATKTTDFRNAAQVLKRVRDRVLALTEWAEEEWRLPTATAPEARHESQHGAEASASAARKPLAPLLQLYHSRRLRSPFPPAAESSPASHLIHIPFPPPGPSPPTEAEAEAGASSFPGLSTTLDAATALAESVFWTIGGGEAARAKASAARARRAKRERDEEEFAGRAVALAGVPGREDGGEAEGEEEETVWDFFGQRKEEGADDS